MHANIVRKSTMPIGHTKRARGMHISLNCKRSARNAFETKGKTMDTQRKNSILATANANLLAMYGENHVNPIGFEDGEKVYSQNVLSVNVDAKTKKGTKAGYLTGIMYFAPANVSGVEVCPMRSAGCTAACLFSAGRGRFYTTTRQRIVKTLAYQFDSVRFVNTVKKSIKKVIAKAERKNLIPVIRLNGTSDIQWERVSDIIQTFPDTQFYDYTKVSLRFTKPLPPNYHLTFSLSEVNAPDVSDVLALGGNVAAVFRTATLPNEYWGYAVVNGDETDLRFLDGKGVVVGLKAKGRAKKDKSGFVVELTATVPL